MRTVHSQDAFPWITVKFVSRSFWLQQMTSGGMGILLV